MPKLLNANTRSIWNIVQAVALIVIPIAAVTYATLIRRGPPKILLFSLPFFGLALGLLDLQTRQYQLSDGILRVRHPMLPFLNRSYNVQQFKNIRYASIRGQDFVYFVRNRMFDISIPLQGSIPELVEAIKLDYKIPVVEKINTNRRRFRFLNMDQGYAPSSPDDAKQIESDQKILDSLRTKNRELWTQEENDKYVEVAYLDISQKSQKR